MDSRAYLLQLQAAAAAAAPPAHAADDDEPAEPTPKAPVLEFEARGAAHAPAPRQGGGGALAPMGVVAGNAEAVKCPECPKWFASEKAMFGHLRKHPERGYKGATRPTMPRAAAASVQQKPKNKKQVVARKEAGVSVVNMTGAAAATAAGESEKRPGEEAGHSTMWPPTPKLGWAASSCSEDQEAAMILLEMAASTGRSSSETQQHQSVQPTRAPDAVSGHHQMPPEDVEQQQPMLLDHHVAGHLTPEAEQMVQVQPAGNALELSAESQTTPVVKQLTNLEITTKAVLIVVPVKPNKPISFPAGPASVVPVTTKAKKLRVQVQHLEQTAAASPAPPPEGAAAGTPPPRRIPSPASDRKFECPICGKLFPSYQALGGHVSSHAKTARHDDLAAAQAVQNILVHRNQQSARHDDDLAAAQAMQNILLGHRNQSARHDDLAAAQATQNIRGHRDQSAGSASVKDTSAAAGAGVGVFIQERLDSQPPAPAPAPPSAPAPAPQSVAPPPPHVCDVCLLTFSSGQALGGHKRKHWFPEKQAAKIALAAAAAATRDFDLNELPQEGRGEENNQP